MRHLEDRRVVRYTLHETERRRRILAVISSVTMLLVLSIDMSSYRSDPDTTAHEIFADGIVL